MTRPRRYHDSRPPQDTNSPVKLMFGLYQCLHHLSFLTGGGDTGKAKPFARKVEELDRFFIPALPTLNSAFRKRCHATNEKWRTEQIGNLTEHYNWSIEVLKGSISAHLLTQSDMSQYLNQTKKWAKQHFKRKFQNNLFEQVDQMVRKFTIPEHTAKGPVSGSSNKIGSQAVTEPVVTSTPKRKRSLPSSPDTSPTTADQTPKRPKPSTYAEKTKSPPARKILNANKATQRVTKFPPLKKDTKGAASLLKQWQIPKLTKDILVLGDSNLARIPYVNRSDAQVISYSGLNLWRLLTLLQNFKHGIKSSDPGVQPPRIIFVVGINDRNLCVSTNGINLQKVYNEAKKQFPNSKITFYSIPYDRKLKSEPIEKIRKLNEAIEKLCKKEGFDCIPKIPIEKFATCPKDKEPIHWTENCAFATLEHIFAHLN